MEPIEYIGSRPRKAKNKNIYGGWVIIVLAFAAGTYFLSQYSEVLASGKMVTIDSTETAIDTLAASPLFGDNLAAAALARTNKGVTYDGSYYSIDYPLGDIPSDKGMSADIIVRSYRTLGYDLQQLIHEDMEKSFHLYPQLWDSAGPDHNIDHRRVPNLQHFFTTHGEKLSKSRNPLDYKNGDIVTWFKPGGKTEIGIIVPSPSGESATKWVVRNDGSAPLWEDGLFDYQIIGHYRFGSFSKNQATSHLSNR